MRIGAPCSPKRCAAFVTIAEMEGCPPQRICPEAFQTAVDKARTAAIYRRPSKVFEDQVKNGRVSALALHGAVALQGGVPITVNGAVIGGIGVSGETPSQDEEIAFAGAAVAGSFTKP